MRGYQQNQFPSRKHKQRNRSRSPRRRSRSYQKERSRSRSKGRKHKRHEVEFNFIPTKIQSDIRNHFKFIIPHLNRDEQAQTLSMLKNKLTQFIGPVQHVSRSKESRGEENATINVGFKYDIDAMSYLHEIGEMSLHLNNRKIHIKSYPTRVFEQYLPQITKTFAHKEETNGQKNKKRKSPERKRSSSYSSESRSESKYLSKEGDMILCLFGIPTSMKENQIFGGLNSLPHGPYKVLDYEWRRIKNSNCEYLQIRIQAYKVRIEITEGVEAVKIQEQVGDRGFSGGHGGGGRREAFGVVKKISNKFIIPSESLSLSCKEGAVVTVQGGADGGQLISVIGSEQVLLYNLK